MLTFDKIRDLERTERSKKLQKMPEDIIPQLKDYLRRKEKGDKTSNDMLELENIKSTIKRLFEMRENKILAAVLDTVRTGLPAENMTKSEEEVFYKLVDILKHHRESFFEELNKQDAPKLMYRVKKTLPSFVGTDMKNYTLVENDVIDVPAPLSELLLKEGVIEKMS